MDEYLGCPPSKILGTIIKVDQRRTSTNGADNKKTNDLTYQRRHRQTVCVRERRKINFQHSRQRWCVDTKTQRLHKKSNVRLIIVIRNNTDYASINETEITRKQKLKENISVDTSSNKQTKSHTKNLDMAKKLKP